MPVLSLKAFAGVAPKVSARRLQDYQAQTALNTAFVAGGLRPIINVSASVHSLTKTGPVQTIYKFGQDTAEDHLYWFHWIQDVDVCRGQIAGDQAEWTFFTGDGVPKGTKMPDAVSGSDFPTETCALGVTPPATKATVTRGEYTTTQYPASVRLTQTHIGQLSATYGIDISHTTDEPGSYTTVSLSDPITAASVVSAINTALSTYVTATEENGTVLIESVATGPSATLFVKHQVGTTGGTLSFETNPNTSVTGAATTPAELIITSTQISAIQAGDDISLQTEIETPFSIVGVGGTYTATTLAAAINSQVSTKLTASVEGSSVKVVGGTQASSSGGFIRWRRTYLVYYEEIEQA